MERRGRGTRGRAAERDALERPALIPRVASTRLLGGALFFGLAVAQCFAYGVRDRPILADTQLYYFIGERVASGVAPHVSQVDIKTALGPIVMGTAIRVGRVFGVPDIYSARAASVAAVAVSVALVFVLTLELTGAATAAVVAAAALLTTHGFFVEAVTGASPKVFMVPFFVAALLAATRRRWLACGLAGAAAFLTWQPGAVVLGAASLALVTDRHSRWADAGRFALGAVVAVLAYEAYFAWHGALGEQLHQELVLAFLSGPREFHLYDSLWFFVTESRAFQRAPNVVPTLFLVVGLLALLALAVRPRRSFEIVRSRPGDVAFWVAAAVGTAFTVYEHQAHPDMLLVQPGFAVACGIGFAWVASLLRRIRAGTAITVLAAALVLVASLFDARQDARAATARPPLLRDQVELANLVGLYRDHRGSVWVIGAAHLLGLERADNHVPHAYLAGPITTEIDFARYRPLKDGRMPEILVVSRGIIPGTRSWLKSEYVEITPAPFARQRIRVYARRQPGVTWPKPVSFAKPKTPAKPSTPAKPAPKAAPAASPPSG